MVGLSLQRKIKIFGIFWVSPRIVDFRPRSLSSITPPGCFLGLPCLWLNYLLMECCLLYVQCCFMLIYVNFNLFNVVDSFIEKRFSYSYYSYSDDISKFYKFFTSLFPWNGKNRSKSAWKSRIFQTLKNIFPWNKLVSTFQNVISRWYMILSINDLTSYYFIHTKNAINA